MKIAPRKKEAMEIGLGKAAENKGFSGAVGADMGDGEVRTFAWGLADRTGERENLPDTKFGIASGCKVFTAVAVLRLVEEGKLSLESTLEECLDETFPDFDRNITVHQLLTHTSGVPDYFDEAVMDDFQELWKDLPMYTIRSLKDFLPLFRDRGMMFTPGERFHYNNAGYILLGLIVEQASGIRFTDYVEEHIFRPAGMTDSGYWPLDRLPKNTATGYIDEEDGTWRTNVYSLPVQGGSDGGAFTTVPDMHKFWDALLRRHLLGEELTALMLTRQAADEDGDGYGYGVWVDMADGHAERIHVMGYDPGVSFHSAIYPSSGAVFTAASNKSKGAYPMMEAFEEHLHFKEGN
ncbi:serine hydrolase domain-containing protein [Bhargavaea cecembensis]|nr:serine hydrolase [Bhargavaea cecembensis]